MIKIHSLTLAVALLTGTPVILAQEAAQPTAPAATAEENKPKRITLNLEGATAEEAFDAIAKQAGIDLVVDNQGMWQQTDLIFINVKDAPFWPTFLSLCEQARVNFDMYYGSDRPRAIRLYASGGENRFAKLPRTEADGFIVFAQSANRSYSVSYDNPANINSQFGMQLMIFADPALQITQLGAPTLTEAVDENGLSLLPPASTRGNSYYGGGRMESLMQNAGVQLHYPEKAGKKIASMKGMLRATAVTKLETIEIESPLTAKPLKKEMPTFDVIIQPMKLQKEDADQFRYELKVTFLKKGTGGLRRENHEFYNLTQTMSVTDAEGRRYNMSNQGSSGSNESMVVTVQFYGQPSTHSAPAKLTWRLAAETKEIRVPFELRDLRIP
jgi:hypothetical protein